MEREIGISQRERRRDGDRKHGDVWSNINDVFDISKIEGSSSPSDLENRFQIMDLSSMDPDVEKFFLHFGVIPLRRGDSKGLLLNNPFGRAPSKILSDFSGFLVLASKETCQHFLHEYLKDKEDIKVLKEDISPVKFINKMAEKIESIGASDVSLNWTTKDVNIIYTIDNQNIKNFEDHISLEYAEKVRFALINMSYERPSDKLIDGKFVLMLLGDKKEYRISSIETVSGYSVVIRSYQVFNTHLTLRDLGYLNTPREIIEAITDEKYGLFLVTGATGSGKTTTIYTILQEQRNIYYKKIKTAEDPVEIQIEGIDQSQINTHGDPKHHITYSKLLRSFMRQKPDIISIGEIRDKSVASACTEAALTGHFVISTLHTNDIESTFTRLKSSLDISVDRIEDSIAGILSQRLVPKLCSCKKKSGKKFTRNEKGCDLCRNENLIGYKGVVMACSVVKTKFMIDNWKPENFEMYYSYDDCAKDLMANGDIDEWVVKHYFPDQNS